MESGKETLHQNFLSALLSYNNMQAFENKSGQSVCGSMDYAIKNHKADDLQGYQYLTNCLLLKMNEKLTNDIKSHSTKIARLEKCLGVGGEMVGLESYWWYEKVSRFAKIINSNAVKIENLQLEYSETKQEISRIMQVAKPSVRFDGSVDMFVKDAIDALFMETNKNRIGLDTIEKICNDHKAAIDLCSLSLQNMQEKLEKVSERRYPGRDTESWKTLFSSGKDDLAKDLKALSVRIDKLERQLRPQSLKREVHAESYWLHDKILAFSKVLNSTTEKLKELYINYSNIKQEVEKITNNPHPASKCECSSNSFLKEAVDTLFVEVNQNKNNIDVMTNSQCTIKSELWIAQNLITEISNKVDGLTEKTTDQLNQMWRLVNTMNTQLKDTNSYAEDDNNDNQQPSYCVSESEERIEEENKKLRSNESERSVEDLCKDVIELIDNKMQNNQAVIENESNHQHDKENDDDVSHKTLIEDKSSGSDVLRLEKPSEKNVEISRELQFSVAHLHEEYKKQGAKINDLYDFLAKLEKDNQNLSENAISGKVVQEKFKEMFATSDDNCNDFLNDGIDGICQFAIQINDKVTEISNRILASEFKISQIHDEILLTKKGSDQSNKESVMQLNVSLRRLDAFETTIEEMKKDIDKCKAIMSNDFILLNEEESNLSENIGFNWGNDKKMLPQNLVLGQQGTDCSDTVAKQPKSVSFAAPKSPVVAQKNRSLKLQIVPCIPEFYSIVNSIDTNFGHFDSITTQDELRDLCSRKLALIKDTNRSKHNPETDLED